MRVCSTVCSGKQQWKHQGALLLVLCRKKSAVKTPNKGLFLGCISSLLYVLYTKLFIHTVYPKKYAHGFVVLCFVVVIQSFIMNSHEVFIHIHQGCFAGTRAIVRLPQCQWSKPDGYGKISQCITTTKHSKAKTVCICLGIYCICWPINVFHRANSLLCNIAVNFSPQISATLYYKLSGAHPILIGIETNDIRLRSKYIKLINLTVWGPDYTGLSRSTTSRQRPCGPF